MAGDERPPAFDRFDARLERLRGARTPTSREDGEGDGRLRWGDGLQVGIELVAGVAGGLLAGWALDRWLGTAPLAIVVGFVLGAAAGMLNAWRWMRRLERRAREGRDGPA
jgi:ATP synthase protein I